MLLAIGIILILIAIAIRYWVAHRKFYRRNQFGNETFKSFGKAEGTRIFENFLQFISIFLIVVGTLLIIAFFIYDPNMSDFKPQHATR